MTTYTKTDLVEYFRSDAMPHIWDQERGRTDKKYRREMWEETIEIAVEANVVSPTARGWSPPKWINTLRPSHGRKRANPKTYRPLPRKRGKRKKVPKRKVGHGIDFHWLDVNPRSRFVELEAKRPGERELRWYALVEETGSANRANKYTVKVENYETGNVWQWEYRPSTGGLRSLTQAMSVAEAFVIRDNIFNYSWPDIQGYQTAFYGDGETPGMRPYPKRKNPGHARKNPSREGWYVESAFPTGKREHKLDAGSRKKAPSQPGKQGSVSKHKDGHWTAYFIDVNAYDLDPTDQHGEWTHHTTLAEAKRAIERQMQRNNPHKDVWVVEEFYEDEHDSNKWQVWKDGYAEAVENAHYVWERYGYPTEFRRRVAHKDGTWSMKVVNRVGKRKKRNNPSREVAKRKIKRRRRKSKALTPLTRARLKRSDFAVPQDRGYPIEDIEHARLAVARAVQHHTRKNRAGTITSFDATGNQIMRAIAKRYPQQSKNWATMRRWRALNKRR